MKVQAFYCSNSNSFVVKGDKLPLSHREHVDLDVKHGARSAPQHRLLFAALKVAYDNWPEDHEFQPVDADDLRYWLEVKAGHGVKVEFSDATEMLDFIRRHWRDNMVIDYPNVWLAKSIKYGRMHRESFHDLVDDIDRVLAEEAGFCLADCKMSALDDAQ